MSCSSDWIAVILSFLGPETNLSSDEHYNSSSPSPLQASPPLELLPRMNESWKLAEKTSHIFLEKKKPFYPSRIHLSQLALKRAYGNNILYENQELLFVLSVKGNWMLANLKCDWCTYKNMRNRGPKECSGKVAKYYGFYNEATQEWGVGKPAEV